MAEPERKGQTKSVMCKKWRPQCVGIGDVRCKRDAAMRMYERCAGNVDNDENGRLMMSSSHSLPEWRHKPKL